MNEDIGKVFMGWLFTGFIIVTLLFIYCFFTQNIITISFIPFTITSKWLFALMITLIVLMAFYLFWEDVLIPTIRLINGGFKRKNEDKTSSDADINVKKDKEI